MKKLSQNQLMGRRGEHLVAERTLAMGFSFDIRNRLETGVDGFLELRDQQTGQMLAKWVGVQVKTTESSNYVYEDGLARNIESCAESSIAARKLPPTAPVDESG